MPLRRAAAVAALLAAGWAHAGPLEDAQLCSAVTDSLARLTCFDRVFPKARAGAAATPPAAVTTTLWNVTEEKSPIDDTPKVFATLEAPDPASASRHAALLLRCQENQTHAFFYHGDYLTGTPAVFFRFDEEQAQFHGDWNASSDQRAVGAWDPPDSIRFIRKLVSAKKLAVRVQGNNRRVEVVFDDLSNVAEAAFKVATACGWKLG